MGILVKDSSTGGDFEPLPSGTHAAVCITIADLGLQPVKGYDDKQKVWIAFEVPGERIKDKEGNDKGPAIIGSMYTMSLNKKAILSQHLESWRGKAFTDDERNGFDITTVLGVPAMISVVHNEVNGKTYANINAIMRPPKGVVSGDPENELVAYTPDDPELAKNLEKLPEWLRKKAEAGHKLETEGMPQVKQPLQESTAEEYFDDDGLDSSIPF